MVYANSSAMRRILYVYTYGGSRLESSGFWRLLLCNITNEMLINYKIKEKKIEIKEKKQQSWYRMITPK